MGGTRWAVKAPHAAVAAPAEAASPSTEPDPASLEQFRRFRRTADPQLRQELVCHYLPFTRKIARRYVRAGLQLDDLVQIGTIGLMNAVNSFDPERGVRFEGYAYYHVAGEIRHYLRDASEHVRAPRSVRKRYRALTDAVAELRQTLGRTPTRAEIAALMNLTESAVLEIVRAHNRSRVHSISDLEEGHEGRCDVIAHQRYVSFRSPVEDRMVLFKAVQRLADVQRKVVYYFFYQDLTQGEVAKRLGVSQRHVSRVLSAALERLGAHLELKADPRAIHDAKE